MKRKDLKKHINYLCGELLAECIAATNYSKKDNKQDVEPGSTALFFKKLRESMQKRTDEIIDQIQNL